VIRPSGPISQKVPDSNEIARPVGQLTARHLQRPVIDPAHSQLDGDPVADRDGRAKLPPLHVGERTQDTLLHVLDGLPAPRGFALSSGIAATLRWDERVQERGAT
jgi:hypothetical protein